MKRKVLALACTLALSAGLLAGCGSSTDTAAEAESTVAAVESTEAAEAESTEAESTETAAEVESKGTITVAATPVPHAEILEAAKDLMAAEGWDLEIVEFTDYARRGKCPACTCRPCMKYPIKRTGQSHLLSRPRRVFRQRLQRKS